MDCLYNIILIDSFKSFKNFYRRIYENCHMEKKLSIMRIRQNEEFKIIYFYFVVCEGKMTIF